MQLILIMPLISTELQKMLLTEKNTLTIDVISTDAISDFLNRVGLFVSSKLIGSEYQ